MEAGIAQERADEAPDRAVLAQAIMRISEEMTALLRRGLNRKAIVVLVAHKTKVSTKTINAVLDSLQSLKKDYT